MTSGGQQMQAGDRMAESERGADAGGLEEKGQAEQEHAALAAQAKLE